MEHQLIHTSSMKLMTKKILIGTIVASALVGIGFLSGNFGGTVIDQTPQVEVDGQTIEFPYTDDNSGEDILIRSNVETLGFWGDEEIGYIYYYVENKTGDGQDINFYSYGSDG